jgi:hypothetical protein
MFQAIHGTCIFMLGIDEGLLVGADKALLRSQCLV